MIEKKELMTRLWPDTFVEEFHELLQIQAKPRIYTELGTQI